VPREPGGAVQAALHGHAAQLRAAEEDGAVMDGPRMAGGTLYLARRRFF
jgi:hypothetical protein